jgi:AraC-like DNA-binding protein
MSARFSTATVDKDSQLDYWHDVVCATFVRLGLERPDRQARGFRGEVTAQDLGRLQVATITSEPHAVFRSPAMIRRWSDDDVMVNLAVRGRMVVSQGGRDAVLRPGDFTIHDSARPCRIAGLDPFRMLVLKAPRDVFTACCPLTAGGTAVTIRGDQGAGAVCSAALTCLPAVSGLARPDEAASRAGAGVLELLAAVLSDLAGGLRMTLPRQAQLLRARRYIAGHLDEPDLSPAVVAQALGMSVRYLHQIFKSAGDSPFRWIMQRRLDLAAGLLADPRRAAWTISDVAFGAGFKDTAHFSRAFKECHGMSPSAYRQLAAVST